ncbi:hypothetical protein ACQPYV_30900 [Micromonospora saelicesensis]|uniref:hypothetical protein n=1 Tax=Micromonospora saelicesensis TaxID=285676 RepID=UPI0011BDCC6E|nr:hypothetical protein [Micromonospora saelicesensis]
MGRDWFDWVSLAFNSLATTGGIVGLFVAIRAYKVAKSQGRKSFEVEILRELIALTQDNEFRLSLKESPMMAYAVGVVTARLAMLPDSDLLFWRRLGKSWLMPPVHWLLDEAVELDEVIPLEADNHDGNLNLVVDVLHRDALRSIKQRMI